MKFWSEGLGKKELVMDLRETALDREGEAIILTGTTLEPAAWAYKVTMCHEDWNAVLKTATSAEACAFLSTSLPIGKILEMALWIGKFVLRTAAFRIGSTVGMVALDEAPAQSPSREDRSALAPIETSARGGRG